MKRAISVLLTIVMLFLNIDPVILNALTVKAADPTVIGELTVDTKWFGSTENNGHSYTISTDQNGKHSVCLSFNYTFTQPAVRDYRENEISVSFTGIGDVLRGSILKGETISPTDNDWAVVYDETTDTFTFTNKKFFAAASQSQGGFDVVWELNARECENGFETTFTPVITIKDNLAGTEETYEMKEMYFKFESVHDDHTLALNPDYISAEAYRTADENYIWYDYEYRIDTTVKARGINKSDYLICVEIPEGASYQDVVAIRSDGTQTFLEAYEIDGKTVYGFYDYSVRNGDYTPTDYLDTNKYYTETKFKIGYKKGSAFVGKEVKVDTYLNILYNDETEYDHLTASATTNVEDYSYDYTFKGYSLWNEKYSSYEGYYGNSHGNPYSIKNLLATRLYKGITVEYSINSSISKNFDGALSTAKAKSLKSSSAKAASIGENDSYNTIIKDETPTVLSDDGITMRSLTEDEYYYAYVRLPAKYSYDYKVYVKKGIDSPYEEFTTGNTATEQIVNFPEDKSERVYGFYVIFFNMNESFSYTLHPGIYYKFDESTAHIKTDKGEKVGDTSAGHIVNTAALSMSRTDDDTNTPVYSTYAASNVWLRDPTVTLTSKTSVTHSTGGSKEIGYTMNIHSEGTLKNDYSAELQCFSMYCVVPKYISIDENLSDLIIHGSGFDVQGDLVDDFENYVKSVEILTKENGDTVLAIHFDFSSRPLEFYDLVSVSADYSTYITSVNFEASAADHNFIYKTYIDVDDITITTLNNPDDATTIVTTDTNDIDEDGNTQELMAMSFDHDFLPILPSAWQNKIIKTIIQSKENPVAVKSVTAYNSASGIEENSDSYYTYRIQPNLRNIITNDLVIYDTIERYSDSDGNNSNWQGKLLSIDVSDVEEYIDDDGYQFDVKVYYSSNASQAHLLRDAEGNINDGWTPLGNSTNGVYDTESLDVKVIAVDMGTKNFSGGLFQAPEKDTFICDIYLNMRAPEVTAANAEILNTLALNSSDGKYKSSGTEYLFTSEYSNVNLTNQITFIKVDADDEQQRLSDAEFEIYDSPTASAPIETITTNRLGKATSDNLVIGQTYYYREVNSPLGYKNNNDLVEFTVEKANQTFVINNTKKTGKVVLRKYDSDDTAVGIENKAPLAGAKYKLYTFDGTVVFTDENSDGSFSYNPVGTTDTFVTNDEGKIVIDNLPWGNYYFQETEAPTGYVLYSTHINFFVNKTVAEESSENEIVVNLNHGNKEITNSLIIRKTDSYTGEPLPKTWYNLERYDAYSDKWRVVRSSLYTDQLGELRVDGLKFGKYRFVETNPATGYELNTVTYPEYLILDASKTGYTDEQIYAELLFTQSDGRKTGSTSLTKYFRDEETDTRVTVAGAKYSLYKVNGENDITTSSDKEINPDFLIGNYTTDVTGRLVINSSASQLDIEERYYKYGLEWGNYYYIETYAPKGYEKNNDPIEFTITQDNVDVSQDMDAYENRKTGSVQLKKLNASNQTLEGAVFELYYITDTGSVKIPNPKTADGNYTTNDEGIITAENLKWGKYFFKEIQAPANYALSPNVHFFVNASSCMFTQELECTDEILQARIVIDKEFDELIDDFGSPTFIFKVTDTTKDTVFYNGAINQFTYDESSGKYFGSVEFNVPVGSYKIEEIPVLRYELDGNPVYVTGTDVTVQDVNSSNEITTGNGLVYCTFSGTNGEIEVKYNNKISRYDKFSHTDSNINQIEKEKQIVGMTVSYPHIIDINEENENATVELDKQKLIVAFMYDDGTEKIVYDVANSINEININDLSCISKDGVDVTDGKFIVNNSKNDAGSVQSFVAQLTENSRTYKTVFDVTVGMPVEDIIQKAVFHIDDENLFYYEKNGKYATANVVYFSTADEPVSGDYIVPESTDDGFVFDKWEKKEDAAGPARVFDNLSDLIAYMHGNSATNFDFYPVKAAAFNPVSFNSTSGVQTFTVEISGYYNISCWGASGGTVDGLANKGSVLTQKNSGRGGYTSGSIYLEAGTTLYLYVGSAAGWNGGGTGSGGGATDIRLVNGTWNNFDSLKSRIMVAGGGGGSNNYGNGSSGGDAGGLTGEDGYNRLDNNNQTYLAMRSARGGTQTAGGLCYRINTGTNEYVIDGGSGGSGAFGVGGNITGGYGGGGGGGYYGGSGGCNRPYYGYSNSEAAGAGGSSFISGYAGCDAIDETSTASNIMHTGQPNHYSGYVFERAVMLSGSDDVPALPVTDADGTLVPSTETTKGRLGNGYVYIEYVGKTLR